MSIGAADAAIQLMQLRLSTALESGLDIEERTIQLVGEVSDEMFAFLDASMTFLEGSRKGITIKIASYGGTPTDALAIIGRIKSSPCKITTIGYGYIMSAASLILACGDKRKMSQFAQFMTHQSQYIVEGSHTEVVEYVKQAERDEKIWATYMAQFSNMPAEHWYELHKSGKDIFLTADDCLKFGIVDELI